MFNSAVAVRAVNLLLGIALLAPAVGLGSGLNAVGAASKGFRAGKYYNRAATIATLSVADLKNASKAENLDGLLVLAQAERRSRFNEVVALQAWEKYNKIPGGDRLLLQCMKDPKCEPLACADIARLSELHREIVLRQPGKGLTQVNHIVGDISEQVMVRHFEGTGWQRIEGQIGRGGIDGLFVKRNAEGGVREVLVAESKYNTSTLQTTNYGEQMSRDWVLRKLQQLRERQPDDATYRSVEQLIQGGYYRPRLWTMSVNNGELRISLQRVRSNSDTVEDLIEDSGKRTLVPPETIRIAAPKDTFERNIVDAYNEALHKLGAVQ